MTLEFSYKKKLKKAITKTASEVAVNKARNVVDFLREFFDYIFTGALSFWAGRGKGGKVKGKAILILDITLVQLKISKAHSFQLSDR